VQRKLDATDLAPFKDVTEAISAYYQLHEHHTRKSWQSFRAVSNIPGFDPAAIPTYEYDLIS
jgi:hypothetical protein